MVTSRLAGPESMATAQRLTLLHMLLWYNPNSYREWIDWLRSGETGAVLIGLVANMSQRKITRDHGQHLARTIWTAPVERMIVTAVTLRAVRRKQIMPSLLLHSARQRIRLFEYSIQRRQMQQTRSFLPSALPNHSGNAEGLWLSPQIYGGSKTHPRRI